MSCSTIDGFAEGVSTFALLTSQCLICLYSSVCLVACTTTFGFAKGACAIALLASEY